MLKQGMLRVKEEPNRVVEHLPTANKLALEKANSQTGGLVEALPFRDTFILDRFQPKETIVLYRTLLVVASMLLASVPSIAAAQDAKGPAIGTQIENFSLVDQDGNKRELNEMLKSGPLAIVFFRSAQWCPFCKAQLEQLQGGAERLQAAGVQFAAISYDSPETLKGFADAKKITFPLLADQGSKVIQQFGLVNEAGKEGTRQHLVAHPMTVLLDSKGVVKGTLPATVRNRNTVDGIIQGWEKFAMAEATTESSDAPAALNFKVKDIDGKDVELSQYAGKVVVVVNVASRCGYTPQYESLQKIYQEYADQGLVVLGFPCNQFGGQEPGSEADIQEFCKANYGVKFDMFSKVDVKGDNQHPFFKYLTAVETEPKAKGDVSWNFEKFVIDRKGNVTRRFASREKPDSTTFTSHLKELLAETADK